MSKLENLKSPLRQRSYKEDNELEAENLQSLPNKIKDQYSKLYNIHPAQPINYKVLLSCDILKTMCCQVYEDHGHEFQENIKELWTRFSKKGSLVDSRLREAEDAFVHTYFDNDMDRVCCSAKSSSIQNGGHKAGETTIVYEHGAYFKELTLKLTHPDQFPELSE